MNRRSNKLVAMGYGIALLLVGANDVSAFYNPTTGKWLNRDPIEEEGAKLFRGNRTSALVGGPNSYLFVESNPISHWDYLGLDNPGCDIPFFDSSPNDSRLHDCLLRCCAQHDHCYFTRNGRAPNGDRPCRARSWLVVWNPCSPCGGCNRQALGCYGACLLGGGPDDGDRWFCPNGPNRGRFYDVWEEIPADCWESRGRP